MGWNPDVSSQNIVLMQTKYSLTMAHIPRHQEITSGSLARDRAKKQREARGGPKTFIPIHGSHMKVLPQRQDHPDAARIEPSQVRLCTMQPYRIEPGHVCHVPHMHDAAIVVFIPQMTLHGVLLQALRHLEEQNGPFDLAASLKELNLAGAIGAVNRILL